jgi:hypothetical protein
MKGKVLIAGVMMLLSWSLLGCGSEGGAPGSSNADKTGVLIQSVTITTTDTNGKNLHVFPTTPPSTDENAITLDEVTMNIVAAKRNETGLSQPFPASLEECTITYLKAVEDPSSPIIPSLTTFPNCILTETTAEASNECSVTLIDAQRKRDYWNAINKGLNLPAEYPTHYVAQYYCKYLSNFGEYGYFPIEYDFYLGQ